MESSPSTAPLSKNSESNNSDETVLSSEEKKEGSAEKKGGAEVGEDLKKNRMTLRPFAICSLKKAKEHAALRREKTGKDREKPSLFPQQQMSLSWPEEDLSGEDGEPLSLLKAI